jgi:hypothetical protein
MPVKKLEAKVETDTHKSADLVMCKESRQLLLLLLQLCHCLCVRAGGWASRLQPAWPAEFSECFCVYLHG